MKCILVGFFNSPNIGDCVIADTLYKVVSSEFVTEKYSYSGNPDIVTNINDISSTNLPKSKNKRAQIYDGLKRFNLTLPIILYRKLKRPTNYLASFETKIRNVDILVIGGGNMIFDKDKYSNSAFRFNEFISIAKKNNTIVFAISIGIGPFETLYQEKSAIMALKKCDYISFRDQKSYDIYAKYTNDVKNVFLSVDPVFSIPYTIKPNVSNVVTIGLNIFNSKLINDNDKEYKQLIAGYVKLARELTEILGVRIVLFSTDLQDYGAVYDVYNHCADKQNIEVRDINGFDSLIELYSDISILIGTRMHSMIIAFTQHIPIIGLSWQPKVDALFDIIDSKDCVYKYDTIESCVDTIINCCRKKMNNLKYEKVQIKERLMTIRQNRSIDSDILCKLSQTNRKEIKGRSGTII